MTKNNNYKKMILMTLLIAPLFTSAIVIGNIQPASAGFPGGGPCSIGHITPVPLLILLGAPPDVGILNGDKCFFNFKNFFGNANSAAILVDTAVNGDELGLVFTDIGNTLSLSGPGGIGVVFEYDVISFGAPIVDNSLFFNPGNFVGGSPSPLTKIVVQEQVLDTAGAQIAFKEIFLDNDGGLIGNDHVDFAPQQLLTINTDIGVITNPNDPGANAGVVSFSQTFSQQPENIDVDIDIKPGSFPNSINPRSMGLVPVAILGSDSLDVFDVDVTTLSFGPGGATPVHLDNGAVAAEHYEDVNDDGFTDLVTHYVQKEALPVEPEACLTGALDNGTLIEGCDSVRTPGNK